MSTPPDPENIQFMAHAREIATLLGRALRLSAPRNSDNESIAAMLAASIHDGVWAVITLVDSRGESQIPVLTRSTLEAFADLCCCCNDPEHARWLQHRALRGRVGVWKNYLALDSLASDRSNADARLMAERRISVDERRIAELEKMPIPKKHVTDKFKSPNIPPRMREVYTLNCGPGHNDVESLLERFIEGGLDPPAYRIGMPLPSWVRFDTVFTSIMVAMQVIALIPKFADVDQGELDAVGTLSVETMNRMSEIKLQNVAKLLKASSSS